jgi:hypothetical protein
MSRNPEDDAGCLFTLVAVVFTAVVASVVFYDFGYRAGAQDVANGNTVVVLMPDGTKVVSRVKSPHKGGLEKAAVQEVPHGP